MEHKEAEMLLGMSGEDIVEAEQQVYVMKTKLYPMQKKRQNFEILPLLSIIGKAAHF